MHAAPQDVQLLAWQTPSAFMHAQVQEVVTS
jgi:hypothetical protein